MRRREFITLAGGTAAWPLLAFAQQQGRLRRIALLMNLPENDGWSKRCVSAFRQGLLDLGWIEGRDIQIDYRFATGDPRSVPASVAELIALKPDVILASASEGLAAFLEATRTIPIVFVSVSDPVGQGFVASLDKPGGHITGFTAFEFSMGGKWVELLKEIPSTTSPSSLTRKQHPTFRYSCVQSRRRLLRLGSKQLLLFMT
jgi:putative ABC transport system substrate-binding protein